MMGREASGERPTGPLAEALDLSEAALAALVGHPAFERALMAVAARAVEQYRASWILNRILSDRGRMVTAFMTLDQHYASAHGRGFAVAQLRDEAARHGFASPGRVTAWVATMRLLGFLAAVGPSRPQRVVPTEKFFAILRDRMRGNWQAIALLHPPMRLAIERLDDHRFLAQLAAGLIGLYRAGHRAFGGTPELAPIADREAGVCILFSVLLREAAVAKVSIAPLAKEFHVSRAHVRAILQAAEAIGMLARCGEGGQYSVTPLLKARISRFVATLFQAHIHAIDRALALSGPPLPVAAVCALSAPRPLAAAHPASPVADCHP